MAYGVPGVHNVTNRRITVSILVAMAGALICWDLYVAVAEVDLVPGEGGTISEVILAWCRGSVAMTWGFGVLCGHLFVPQIRERKS